MSLWCGVLRLLKLIVLGKDLVKKEYIFRERERKQYLNVIVIEY